MDSQKQNLLINPNDPVLVTGAAGFIGARVVANLVEKGFRDIRCLVRHSTDLSRLRAIQDKLSEPARIQIITGNLLSTDDCKTVAKDVAVIYHLAAGTGIKSFSEAYLNSVVTTRNLLEAALSDSKLRRFVNLSSFGVYSSRQQPSKVLDEQWPMEEHPESRAEAYCYAKVKQDELVMEYGKTRGLPYVLLRPGNVYGPGKRAIPGRVGIDSFGIYLHLGGSNIIPFTFVDNCADAIVLAGLKKGIDGEVFNILDDNLPSSRQFLRNYKKEVKRFRSIYLPPSLSYFFCFLWEKYSQWSQGQLPPLLTRAEWAAFWKPTRFSNEKLKNRLGWSPKISTEQGMQLFFEGCRQKPKHA
jgi:nucleoside-diphosphate-sugar epimerase